MKAPFPANDDILIRPAAAKDIEAMAGFLTALFSIEQDFHPDMEKQRRGLRLLLRNPAACALVAAAAASDNEPVGMVCGQLLISTAEGGLSLLLEDMFVVAAWRGCGLGRRLVDALLDWARAQGASRAQLLADADNAPALEFYHRVGWNQTRLAAWRKMLR
ncbi:MAG: GNAT family N-acetyltransferase [Desulfobulbaceae bacterium]|jgi:GNAT superfamily N-acetyltransferase|nr:GNAT family N-acetyltransferase [Desulfobulbaceae bacterium]